MAKKEEAWSISTSAFTTRTEMVSEASVRGGGRLNAALRGILRILFGSVSQWAGAHSVPTGIPSLGRGEEGSFTWYRTAQL